MIQDKLKLYKSTKLKEDKEILQIMPWFLQTSYLITIELIWDEIDCTLRR